MVSAATPNPIPCKSDSVILFSKTHLPKNLTSNFTLNSHKNPLIPSVNPNGSQILSAANPPFPHVSSQPVLPPVCPQIDNPIIPNGSQILPPPTENLLFPPDSSKPISHTVGFGNEAPSFAKVVGTQSLPPPSPILFVDVAPQSNWDVVSVRKASIFGDDPFIPVSPAKINILSRWFQWAVIGKFSHSKPAFSEISKGVKNLKLVGNFSVGNLDKKHIFVNFEKEADFLKVLLKKSLQICGAPMRIFKYSFNFNPSFESPFVPVWISLFQLPLVFFDKAILFSIASVLGTPLQLDEPTARKSRTHVAHVCVVMDISKPRVNQIRIGNEGYAIWQSISYESVPDYCSFCKHVGHPIVNCFWKPNVDKKQEFGVTLKESFAAVLAPFPSAVVLKFRKELKFYKDKGLFSAKEIQTRRNDVSWHSDGEVFCSQPLKETYSCFSDGDDPQDATNNNLQISDCVRQKISSFKKNSNSDTDNSKKSVGSQAFKSDMESHSRRDSDYSSDAGSDTAPAEPPPEHPAAPSLVAALPNGVLPPALQPHAAEISLAQERIWAIKFLRTYITVFEAIVEPSDAQTMTASLDDLINNTSQYSSAHLQPLKFMAKSLSAVHSRLEVNKRSDAQKQETAPGAAPYTLGSDTPNEPPYPNPRALPPAPTPATRLPAPTPTSNHKVSSPAPCPPSGSSKSAHGLSNAAPELSEEPFTTVVNRRSKRNQSKAK